MGCKFKESDENPRDLIGDAVVLPIQVDKEVDADNHQFFHSQSHSSIHDEVHVSNLKSHDDIHAVDNNANLSYVKDNEIDNEFFKYTPN